MPEPIERHKTAMSRSDLSRPVKQALDDALLPRIASFFDFGCGHGDDVRQLRLLGYEANGWDPVHAPLEPLQSADVVNLGYVVNVIEHINERREALKSAWGLATGILIVAARLDWELSGFRGRPFKDGFVTGDNTFQKFYSQDELRGWIESTLGHKPVAASPGVFYVFRDPALRETLLASRSRGRRHQRTVAELIYAENREALKPLESWIKENHSLPTAVDVPNGEGLIDKFGSIRSAFGILRRASTVADWSTVDAGSRNKSERRFEQELEVLQPLIDYVEQRGRLPRTGELEAETELVETFGSIGRGFTLIRRVTGSARWNEAAETAKRDLLVYVALSNFGGRPRFSDLPSDIQHDVRDLVGSYKTACSEADEMLFQVGDLELISRVCADSSIGKLTPEALYVHVSALGHLHPLLRLYEGCSRVLVGEVPGHVVLKLNRLKPQVSYLLYPDFDKRAHPPVIGSIVCRISKLEVAYRSFRESNNPHILHRKDLVVAPDYPLYDRFARLSDREEASGLLNQVGIGTEAGWAEVLRSAGIRIKGHRLYSA